MVVSRQRSRAAGMPAYTVTAALDPAAMGLRLSSVVTEVERGGRAPAAVRTVEYAHAGPDWAALDPGAPESSTATSHAASGAPLSPSLTRRCEWDGPLLTKGYAEAADGARLGAEFAYDGRGRPVLGRPFLSGAGGTERGAATAVSYAADGLPRAVTVGDGASSYTSAVASRDANGLPTSSSDALGAASTAEYDDRGRPVRARRGAVETTCSYPDGPTAVAVSAADGDPRAVESGESRDALGRPRASWTVVSAAGGAVLESGRTEHAHSGRTSSAVTVRNGVRTVGTRAVDRPGRVALETSPDGSSVSYAYAAAGASGGTSVTATLTRGALSLSRTDTYDAAGRLARADGPMDGEAHEYSHDGLGNLTAHRAAAWGRGAAAAQTRRFAYDALGRMTRADGPEAGTTTYGSFTVHGLPRVVVETLAWPEPPPPGPDPGPGPKGPRDESADPVPPRDPGGPDGPAAAETAVDDAVHGAVTRRRRVAYDAFGRALSVASGGDSLSYEYSASRPLLLRAHRASDGPGGPWATAQEYAHDALGRLVSEAAAGPGGHRAAVGYAYGPWGHLARVAYPGGRAVLYETGPTGRAERVMLDGPGGPSPLASLEYDPLGRRTATLFASGAMNEYAYDFDRVASWTFAPAGGPPAAAAFSYDEGGRLASDGDWDIARDPYGRVASAAGHGALTLHGHDGFGNSVAHSAAASPAPPSAAPPPTMIDWSLPPLLPRNRVPPATESGAETWWQYSENGEAEWVGTAPGGGRLRLAWDGLGALKSVSDGLARHGYAYAPSGPRVLDGRTGDPPGERRFVYAAGGALPAVCETGGGRPASRRDIVHAGGAAIAEMDQDGNVYGLHCDRLGSPRHVTDGTPGGQALGGVVGRQAFGPYGERMVGVFNGKEFPWGYRPATGWTGHLGEDPTGLVYMGGRYYSPLWHRFVSPDRGADPNSLNQYAYAGGRPFDATDPSGMAWLCATYSFTTASAEYFGGGATVALQNNTFTECIQLGGGGGYGGYGGEYGGGGHGHGGGGSAGGRPGGGQGGGAREGAPDQCKKLHELGVTKEVYERMQNDYVQTYLDQQALSPQFSHMGRIYTDTTYERGFAYTGGQFLFGAPGRPLRDVGNTFTLYTGMGFVLPENATGFTSHIHPEYSGVMFQHLGAPETAKPFPLGAPSGISRDDMDFAAAFKNMTHIMGWSQGLVQYNQSGVVQNLGGHGWWDVDCSKWLK